MSRKDHLEITLTIPIGVTELFFDAKNVNTGEILKDWFDYFGETEVKDFELDVNKFLSVLASKEVRITNQDQTIEYLDDEWSYLFGKYEH